MKAGRKTSIPTPPWQYDSEVQLRLTEAVSTVANELYARIVSGRYPNGSRLPPERLIGHEFGCSRTVVRKALEVLDRYSILSSQRSRSRRVTYLRPNADADQKGDAAGGPGSESLEEIAEITSPLELNVVRSIVEPEIVRLATINMSARDIANLRKIVDRLSAVTTDVADFARWDEQLHLALAEGTHNVLLIAVYKLINDVRRHSHWQATRQKTLSPRRIKDYQKLYRSICSALEARDMESAIEFVKLIMVETQRDLTLDN